MDAKVAKGDVVHVDASLIRANASWESMVERHVEEVMSEHPLEEKGEKKDDKGRGGGGSGQVSRTDPDARLARSGGRGGFEPSYKQHAAVDDARGVVLDVSVTEDSGYAYSKVYGALERRGVAALIPAKKEPSQSRVPLRLFRYDARNNIVKCPRGKTLSPRRDTERGRYYRSKTRDCAGCALREDCLPKAWSSKVVLVPHAYPALSRAVRRGLENMKIQSYLTAAAINLKRLAAALLASLFDLWTARVARKRRLRAHRAHPRRAGFLSAAA